MRGVAREARKDGCVEYESGSVGDVADHVEHHAEWPTGGS